MSKLMIVEVPSYTFEFKGIREVAELIRCKECKWRGIPTACPIDNFYAQRWTRDDDFCSYGEREVE